MSRSRPDSGVLGAISRVRRPGHLLWVLLSATAPALGLADDQDHAGEIAIIAGEVARLQQLDPDLRDIPSLEHRLLARAAAARVMRDSLTQPGLRMIDQLADLATLALPLQQVDLQPGAADLLIRLPAAECGGSLGTRLLALPSFAPADAVEIEATPAGCRLRWRVGADAARDGAAIAVRTDPVPAVAPADAGTKRLEGTDLTGCGADPLDAALERMRQAIERRVGAEVQRARRSSMREALAAIDARIDAGSPPAETTLRSLATSAGAEALDVQTLGKDPPADQRPASFHRRLTARAGLPAAIAVLESLIGHRHVDAASGEVSMLPWLNRGLSSVQLVRAEDTGAPALTVELQQFQPDWHDQPDDASGGCWPKVGPGDGSLAGLSPATRSRVEDLRRRFPGPMTALPDADLPAARTPRKIAHDPFH